MGLAATALAVLQYGPQIALTWSEGFVGALSIPTMAIQVPGSVAFVVSIAIREGTTWSCASSHPHRLPRSLAGPLARPSAPADLPFLPPRPAPAPAWFPYAVTGVLQAGLLAMCLAWKGRQARLGIDDFGRPLEAGHAAAVVASGERTALLAGDTTAAREGPAE